MYSGLHRITISDDTLGLTMQAVVQYPTIDPGPHTSIGPYTFDAEENAPVAEGSFPLLMVSHGGGGSHLLYRTLCTTLAQHGYISVALEHPGNNRNDNTLHGTDDNLVRRTRHISLAIDAMLQHPMFAAHITTDQIAVIGHSIGGTTALALAGGTPWSRERRPIETHADARIKAAVLLAPATEWFQHPTSLRGVVIPLLVLSGDQDTMTPLWQGELVRDGVPDASRVTLSVVHGASHYAFLTPFPPAMRRETFAPSMDPPGFDREQLHRELPVMIEAFLRAQGIGD